jgi:hypothetical protein
MVKEDSLRNDHSTRYCETGQRPQNALIGTSLSERFQEYCHFFPECCRTAEYKLMWMKMR